MIELITPLQRLEVSLNNINEIIANLEDAYEKYKKSGINKNQSEIDRVCEKLEFYHKKREEYQKVIDILTHTKISIRTITRRNHTVAVILEFSDDMRQNGCVDFQTGDLESASVYLLKEIIRHGDECMEHIENDVTEDKKEKDVIEVYYDPYGVRNGKVVCIRARLKKDHRIHSAGTNEKDAVEDLLLTLKSMGHPSKAEDYTYISVAPKDG